MKTFQTRGFQATIDNISILDLMQHMVFQLATGRLTVTNNGVTGYVYFATGRFIHSSVSDLVGEDALLQLIRWPGGNCVFESGSEPDQQTFPDLPGDHLLLDFLRILDETAEEMAGETEEPSAAAEPTRSLTPEEQANFAAARFCDGVAKLAGVVYTGILSSTLSLVGQSDEKFEDDRSGFAVLIEAGERLSKAQDSPLEVIEAYDDSYNFFVVRLKESYLCSRTNCTLGLNELLAHLRDLEGARS